MAPANKALLQIHLCVVIWGFTAILGKLITLTAFALVWWRMLLVVGALCVVPAFWRGLRSLDRHTLAIFAGIGVIVALHWVTFYGAIKLANASIAATCIGMAPIFVSIVEPWVTGRRFEWRELAIGVAAVPGVMLVVGGTPGGMRIGIAVGILSALLVAVFGALNKRYVDRGDALTVTGIELAAGTLFLTALAVVAGGAEATSLTLPGLRDGVLLLILALVCTLFPFALSLVALRNLSAFSAQLAVSLEPVYAVFLAVLLLGEQRELGLQFYLGLAIILGSVFAHVLIRRAPH
ncbi:MAG TPA: DMT family transporter [Steroidobacteraceae bacterium]|nr:DMT family transporter [Steroidobacteraceae bacterium]